MGVWVLFFFSSRRRHTRCSRDWSSDVCSSDLQRHRWITSAVFQSPSGKSGDGFAKHLFGDFTLAPIIEVASGRPYKDRKSTRLNSSHGYISYAVFCLKKKTNARAAFCLCPPQSDYSTASC